MSRLMTVMAYVITVVTMILGGGDFHRLLGAETAAEILAEAGKEARFQDGIARLQAQLEQKPEDAEVRFALGLLQFLGAVDEFAASQYQYGAGGGTARTLSLPFFSRHP